MTLQDTLAQAQGEIALGLIQVYRALGGGWQLRCTGGEEPGVLPPTAPSAGPEILPAPAPEAKPAPAPEPKPAPGGPAKA